MGLLIHIDNLMHFEIFQVIAVFFQGPKNKNNYINMDKIAKYYTSFRLTKIYPMRALFYF